MTEEPQLRLLTKADDVLGLEDIQFEYVDVPEWSMRVRVKSLSGTERDRIEASMIQIKRNGKGKVVSRTQTFENLRAKVIAGTVVNEEGDLVFNKDQVVALGKKNAAALQKVFVVAQRLSALSDDDIEDLTDELGKDQSSDGGSA